MHCSEFWMVAIRSMISINFTTSKLYHRVWGGRKKKEAGYNTGEENSRMYYLLALRRETGMDGE